MAKKLALIAFVALMTLVIAAPAALAAPSETSAERLNGIAAAKAERAITQTTNGHATHLASNNGKSHAPQNAGRGMNRVGAAGTWKVNGHVPSINGFPQGAAPSNPDADGNGGADKPGGSGGFDADRDGNNGCGNDTDREDDNNGWCGKKPDTGPPGGGGPNPPGDAGGGTPPAPPKGTVVLPERTERAAPSAPLPTTGSDVGGVMWAGWGLVLAGTALRRSPRRGRR